MIKIKSKDIDISCWSTQDEYMMVKISSMIQQNIVAPKLCLSLIFNLNYTFTGEWVGGWMGWMAGLMVNKAHLSKAELAAVCC